MKLAQHQQLVVEAVQVVNVGNELVDDIHHKPGVVLEDVVQSLLLDVVPQPLVIPEEQAQEMILHKGMQLEDICYAKNTNFFQFSQNDCPGGEDLSGLKEQSDAMLGTKSHYLHVSKDLSLATYSRLGRGVPAEGLRGLQVRKIVLKNIYTCMRRNVLTF